MAACQLTIRLNDEETRSGGAPISGVVSVRAEKKTHCKGLIVRTTWSTHGRGNIDTGEVASQTVFEGEWQAGQEYTYPFTLATASWPPTYYGQYLNVGHYVMAQAKLSWAIDPKATVEYRVVAQDAPDDLKPTTAAVSKKPGIIVAAILAIVAAIFAFAFLPLVIILVVVLGPIGALFYFFKVILPKRITGPVVCELNAPKVRAGENVQARLEFTPARRSTINGIEWKIRCIEECSSGSGSNRKTHTHELFLETISSSGSLELKPGEKQLFELQYPLPATAAPSLRFNDNQLKWTITARIDIPKWPDWTKTLEPIVIADPSKLVRGHGSSAWDDDDGAEPPIVRGRAISSGGPASEKTLGDEAWLKEVLSQIQQTQHNEDALAMVLAAVKDFEFPIVATMEEEIDTPEFTDEAEFERWDEAEWWAAYCPGLNLDVALAWEDGYPPEVEPNKTWQGRAAILGYEVENKLLLMMVTS